MTNESDALIARTPLPPAWECRCESCQIAVSHGAPEEDRDYEALRDRIAALTAELEQARAQPCPHVVTSDEGTQHCNLAESSVRELKAELAKLRKDANESNALIGERCEQLEDALSAATARAEAAEKNARRYEWLRARLYSIDFEYGQPPMPALVFEYPRGQAVGPGRALDAAIDAALAEQEGK